MILFDSRTTFEKDLENHSVQDSEKVDGNRINKEQSLENTKAACTQKVTGFLYTV